MKELADISQENANRLCKRFLEEVVRTGVWTVEQAETILQDERDLVGDSPPVAVNTSLDGLNTILSTGRLFTVWEVASGQIQMIPVFPDAPMNPKSAEKWKPHPRTIIEDALRKLLGCSGNPVYAALSSSSGKDRATGGMYRVRSGELFLEFDLSCADMFVWGDSFDSISPKDDTTFEYSYVLDRCKAVETKPIMNIIRRHNFPLVGPADFGPKHPMYDRLLCISPQVTSLFTEAIMFKAPSVEQIREIGVAHGALGELDKRRLERIVSEYEWLQDKLHFYSEEEISVL